VALANIAKVDSVAAAAIAKINGLVFTAAAPGAFLLDTYTGAAAGYSTRRLATSATNLMRIREDAGDTETDIGYDSNNELDTAAIATHCGTANGYVVTWYDQSGNSNNATQSTTSVQPQIYNGTSVNTENGKPGVQADDTPQRLDLSSNASVGSGFVVYRRTQTKAYAALLGLNYQNQIDSGSGFGAAISAFDGTNLTSSATASDNTSQFLGSVHLGASSSVRINGSQDGTGTTGTLSVGSIFQRTNLAGNSSFVFVGRIQEIVLYATKQSASNISGIEENINSEYLIYQPTDAPTSGLLADYTGAAAAYSVRQLSDKAVIALRVRRDSDDEERNIGFDANGDLDSQAISDFCSTANGYVTRWWDQSTEGNHADQATDTSQPQIYDGTAVITENGKPTLDFDGSDDFLSVPNDKTSFKFMHTGSFATIETVARFGDSANPNSAYTLFDCGGLSSSDIGTGIFFDDRSSVARNEAWAIQVSAGTGLLSAPVVSITQNQCAPNEQKLIYMEIDADNATAANRCLTAIDAGTSFGGNTNTATPSTADNNRDLHIGRYSQSNALQLLGTMQELILWDADHSASKSDIETDINDYFDIY